MYTWEDINKVDPVIAELIQKEFERQNSHIELIASENWTSPAVTSALGTCLTNKYAEGYPGRRYYGGCEVSNLSRSSVRKSFSAALMQMYSPTPARRRISPYSMRCFSRAIHSWE